ncbi:MAG: methyltransferase domain-containing protein [Pseudomonadota bacterium]
MNKGNLDRVYAAHGDTQMRQIYDEWADQYDADLASSSYVTPRRVAEALARQMPHRDAAIMDYGCGTGLSGKALQAAGFSTIDGVDLSAKMLRVAQQQAVYRKLNLVEPNTEAPAFLSDYAAIAAIGVISRGAAPASLFGAILGRMRADALLAVSINDMSLADPGYRDLVSDAGEAGLIEVLCAEHGPHLEKYGENSGSTVFILKRTAKPQ